MEKDWYLLDEYERQRLIEPYEPVSPAWRHVGWAVFWAATTAALVATTLLFSFSDQIEDWLLLAAGAAGALCLVSALTAVIAGMRHRREMSGPYEDPSAPADASTQIGTSRPARAT